MEFYPLFLLFSVFQIYSASQDAEEKVLHRSSPSKIISSLESFVDTANNEPRSKILSSLESFVGSNSLDISIHPKSSKKSLHSSSLDKARTKEKKPLLRKELVDGAVSSAENRKESESQSERYSSYDSPNKTLLHGKTGNANLSMKTSAEVQSTSFGQSSVELKNTGKPDGQKSVIGVKATLQKTAEGGNKENFGRKENLQKQFAQQNSSKNVNSTEEINQYKISSDQSLPNVPFQNEQQDVAGEGSGFESNSGSGSGSGSGSESGSGSVSGHDLLADVEQTVEKVTQNLNGIEEVPSNSPSSNLQAQHSSLDSVESREKEESLQRPLVWNNEDINVEASASSGSGSSESGTGSGMLYSAVPNSIVRESTKDSGEDVPNIPNSEVLVDVDGETRPDNSFINKTKEPKEQAIDIRVNFNKAVTKLRNSSIGAGNPTKGIILNNKSHFENQNQLGSTNNGKDVAPIKNDKLISNKNHQYSGDQIIAQKISTSIANAEKGSVMSNKNIKSENSKLAEKPSNHISDPSAKSYKNIHKLLFSGYNNNSKPMMNTKPLTKENKALEQEKKLIAQSAIKEKIDDSTSVTLQTIKANQLRTANETRTSKKMKQDVDLTIEKEKELIAASIRNSDSKNNSTDNNKPKKVSNSAELHKDAKASFRQRYFENKGKKVIEKYSKDKLAGLLESVRFGKESSTVSNSTRLEYIKQCGLYVEDYNVSKIGGSWDRGILSQYRYLYEIPKNFSRCSTSAWFNNTDMRGSVYLSFQVRSIMGNTMMNNARVCAKYCCREPRCKAWTMRIQQGETRNCDKGSYCCWLKSAIPEVRSGVENSTSGIVDRAHTRHPPTGMRSAVPLGGITTGSFELHADGTFHEWTIENQSPGGSAKLNKGSLDMALLGVRVSYKNISKAALLRTHPPQGYPGVEKLSYSGAYPLSKLAVGGGITDKVKMDLYAYPSFHPRNPYISAIPAVAFTLNLENEDYFEAMNVSFLLNLPLGYQDDTIRVGSNYGEAVFTRNILPSECAKACAKMPKCMAWTTNGPTACLLKDKMPLHAWQSGIISGLKGVWSKNGTMLTMNRPGFFPQSGSTTIFAVEEKGETTSFASADDFAEIWNRFSETGQAGNRSNVTPVGLHGSASIQTTLKPGQKKSLTIIMSWYYPHRDHAAVNIGNFYSNLFTSSQEAALQMRRNLPHTLSNILEWQAPFLLPSSFIQKPPDYINRLPLWLNDMLMNSVSYWRSSFWTQDGRWRQWEAYDCNDVDTIHNDMQRILPYMLFYPDVVRHLLLSWAANQFTNGMLQEALTEGCLGTTGKLDYAGGRVMADSTSMFVVGVYHYYKWTGQKDILQKLWLATKRAVTWLIVDSTKSTGLPFRKTTFYSLSGIDKYDHHIYDSVVYLLALRASRALATYLKDDIFKKTVSAAIDRAEKLIDKEFWDEHNHHYRAWWDMEYGASDWLMSDSFYGQVWANTLGLGELVPRSKLRRHLNAEVSMNGSPWGLRVINDNQGGLTEEDTSLILSYKYPGCESLESVARHKSIWMGADANWASLMIKLDTDPHTALDQAKKPLDHWRSTLNDQWNIHGQISSEGYGQDGLPWANSHANAHLVMWHIPFTVSGQQYSAPDLSLTFRPKFGTPFELPFFIPTASGLIQGRMSSENDLNAEQMFTLKVISGEVHLRVLKVFESPYGNGEIHLIAGSQVTWSKPKTNVKFILNELKH